MGFDQYHEPPQELSEDTRTFVRVLQSMIEEAEAIDWYVWRLAIEKDEAARSVMNDARKKNSFILKSILNFYCDVPPPGEIS